MKYYSIRLPREARKARPDHRARTMPSARHGGQLPKLAGYQLPSRCDDESSTEEQLGPSSGYGLTRCEAGPTIAEPINLWQASWGRPRSWPRTHPGCRIGSSSSNRAAGVSPRPRPASGRVRRACRLPAPASEAGRVQSLLGREQLTDFLEPKASPAGEVDDRDPDKDGIREHALAAPARWSFQQPHALPLAQGGHRVPGALGDLADRKPAGRR